MKRVGIVFLHLPSKQDIFPMDVTVANVSVYSHICSINNRTLVLVLSLIIGQYWLCLCNCNLIYLHNPIFQRGTCTHVSLTTAPVMEIFLVSEDFRYFVEIQ
ncbi:unnamed protein product [Meganyctiphanes norvegica]|uniref:Uncharacterized protein n=1 Tax=Meganyctiphanes norvegica TaxID=48144 RepID=A0AAV2SNB5_MEGNR